MFKLILPAFFTLAIPCTSFARNICEYAAEDRAFRTAEDSGFTTCRIYEPTRTVNEDALYDVTLYCPTGGTYRIITFEVTTVLKAMKSPKTGKIYYSCSGTSAQEI